MRADGDGGDGIDLELRDPGAGKPPVFHGDRGLSHKGGAPGNASYYYSFTRLPTTGTLEVGGERIAVEGLSWMDREWSTSALSEEQEGWDWFSLQLDDDRELMFYGLRLRAGGSSLDPASSGTLVEPDGTVQHLELSDVEIRVLDRWRSPRSGVRYPSRWRLAVPRAGIDLVVEPILADQELDVGFRYWEGAVDAEGTSAGRPVAGRGYVELTGYGPTSTSSGSAENLARGTAY
jgi:predicted secreted hydrolase